MKKMPKKDSYEWFISKYKELGYPSLNQFALAVGMPKSSLNRYFHLQRQIPSGTLGQLCKILKVSPEELLKIIGAI
jgi:DNA-binding Xre family transcriptional regulator